MGVSKARGDTQEYTRDGSASISTRERNIGGISASTSRTRSDVASPTRSPVQRRSQTMIASMSVVAHSRTALSSSRRSQSIGFLRRLGRLDAEDRVAFRHPQTSRYVKIRGFLGQAVAG